MNFIYTFNEKQYSYDIKSLLARCEQKNNTGLLGLPKTPRCYLSAAQISDLNTIRTTNVLRSTAIKKDFGLGNMVKKNIKFGIKQNFVTTEELKIQFADNTGESDQTK